MDTRGLTLVRRCRALAFAAGLALVLLVLGRVAAAQPAWTPVNKGSMSEPGSVRAVATDPRYPGRVYAAVEQHLLLSFDGGDTFSRIGSLPASDAILAIALVVDSAKVLPSVIVGTRTRGVWVSDDGGRRFVEGRYIGTTPMFIRDLLVAPGSDRVIVVNQYPRAYVSDDGGLNWKPFDVEGRVVPFSATGFYNARESGLYRSTDAGASWTRIGNGLPLSTSPYEIAVDAAQPDVVFAVVARLGTFRSSDAGENFAFAGPPLARTEPETLEVFGDELWLTGWNALWSRDGGKSWATPLPAGSVVADVARDASSGNVYAATTPGSQPGGLWRTPHEGAWVNDSTGLSAARVTSLIVDPQRNLFAGASPSTPLHRFAVDDATWRDVALVGAYARDGFPLGPPSAPIVVAGPGHLIEASWPFARSEDDGATWRTDVVASTPAKFVLASEPGRVDVLYGGRDRVRTDTGSPSVFVEGTDLFVSRDDGRTWTPNGIPGSPVVQRLLATGSARLLAHASDGVWFSSDAGARWSRAESIGTSVRDVRARPDRSAEVIVASATGVYRSDDGGATFRHLASLPDPESWLVAIDSHSVDDVYLVTRSGAVHASRDGGRSWTALGSAMPFRISDVAVSPWNTGVLYAATDRGVHRIVAQPDVETAHEFHHAEFDHYFVTAFADEASELLAGAMPPWRPTGETFGVWNGGARTNRSPVCRFFSASFAPRSSHFYTPYESECDSVRRGGVWEDEGRAFDLVLPIGAPGMRACPAGTQPLYRVYNDGRSGAPNHRYTTDRALADAMLAQHWVLEGDGPTSVFACVPAQQ